MIVVVKTAVKQEWVTLPQAVKITGWSRQTLTRAMHTIDPEQHLKFHQLGERGHYRIRKTDLDEWMERYSE